MSWEAWFLALGELAERGGAGPSGWALPPLGGPGICLGTGESHGQWVCLRV